MTPSKQNLLTAMRAFIRQRSGMDPDNYGDWQSYQSERRSITRDLAHAQRLLDYVAWHDSITADDIVKAASRRLTIKPRGDSGWALDYCTGQYFPTEYRKAAAAVLASAIWDWWRDQCMPAPRYVVGGYRGSFGNLPTALLAANRLLPTVAAVEERYGPHPGVPAGDYLRTLARREFGRAIASRYFN